MSTAFSFLIRDGLESDLPGCSAIDHHYETDYVWQMTVEETPGQWQVMFKTQRLPRTMETVYPSDERRLRLFLPKEQCFLVAVAKDSPEVLGYLTMHYSPFYGNGIIHSLVVSRPFRRQRIGMRLLNVARQWAKERDLTRLTVEIQTKNYPGIVFCQGAGFSFCGYNDHYFPDQDIAVFFTQALHKGS